MELAPHQQRVVAEKAELDEKLNKLEAFFESPIYNKLDCSERKRLQLQASSCELIQTFLVNELQRSVK